MMSRKKSAPSTEVQKDGRQQKLKQEVPGGYKKKPFYPEDSQAGAQVAQVGCAGSILQGFQDWSGQRPEQPGLTSQLTLFAAGGWTRDLPRVPSNLNEPVI